MNDKLCSTVSSNTPLVLRGIFHALTHNVPEDQKEKGG